MKKTLALCLVLSLLLCGCVPEVPEAEVTEPTAPVTEPQETKTPETEPMPTDPLPTELEPTEPEPTEPPVQLHSGIREDGTFDSGTLFIGDSLTYGLVQFYLKEKDLLGDAKYMAITGASPLAYFSGPRLQKESPYSSIYTSRFDNMCFYKGVETVGEEITAIYFMMGTNIHESVTDQTYIDIVNHMLEHCPNATIYLELVPYSLSELVDQEQINWRILAAYHYFLMDLEEPRVRLIETQVAIDYNLASDGIHLTKEGYRLWYQALVDYAGENDIPQ